MSDSVVGEVTELIENKPVVVVGNEPWVVNGMVVTTGEELESPSTVPEITPPKRLLGLDNIAEIEEFLGSDPSEFVVVTEVLLGSVDDLKVNDVLLVEVLRLLDLKEKRELEVTLARDASGSTDTVDVLLDSTVVEGSLKRKLAEEDTPCTLSEEFVSGVVEKAVLGGEKGTKENGTEGVREGFNKVTDKGL